MHTLIAFIEEIDEAGVFANIAASPDDHVDYSGDTIRIVQGFDHIFAGMVFAGTTGTRARVTSPSLRVFQNKYLAPINQVLVPTGNDVIDFHRDCPLPLKPGENIEAEINANPAAAEWHTVAIWLSDGDITPVKGSIKSIPFNITTAIVAGVWQTANMTLDEELPAGEYELVGARLELYGGPVSRFIIPKHSERPGFPNSVDEDFKHHDLFRYGNLGVWGRFNNVSLPKVEVLGSSAVGSATYYGIMDVRSLS